MLLKKFKCALSFFIFTKKHILHFGTFEADLQTAVCAIKYVTVLFGSAVFLFLQGNYKRVLQKHSAGYFIYLFFATSFSVHSFCEAKLRRMSISEKYIGLNINTFRAFNKNKIPENTTSECKGTYYQFTSKAMCTFASFLPIYSSDPVCVSSSSKFINQQV